jgi:hypothetical protein
MSHIDSNNVITIETDPDEHDDRDRKRRKGETGLALDIVSSDGTVRSHRFESPAKPGPPPPRARASYAQSTVERPSDKVIEIPDPKSVKQAIVDSWIAYTPQQIVKLIKKCYPNVATASSQLSNLKSVLVGLANPPPEDWLAQLRLSRKEYKELANAYREKRDKQGRNLQFHTVHDSDVLVQRSLEMMTSSDYRVLWPALVVCSGFRPVEVLTANIKETPSSSNHIHPGFWICVSNWAKKKRGSDFCRDHPLLCPSWLFTRGIGIVRKYFCKVPLTKRQLSQRYSKYQLQLLQKAFPNMVNPTHVLFRRFYAAYSYKHYKEDFQGIIGKNNYITHVLGHTSTEPSLSYINVHLRGAGKINIFQIGKNLKVVAKKQSPKVHVDKRMRPREHSDLADRNV